MVFLLRFCRFRERASGGTLRILNICAVISLVWLPHLSAAQTIIATRGSNIREDPSPGRPAIAHVASGDTLHLLEPQNIGGYGLVRFHQIEGWIWLRNTRRIEEKIASAMNSSPDASLSTPCPVEGDGSGTRQIASDRLKNRTSVPLLSDFDPSITLARVLRKGNDEARFDETKAGELIGYVEKVKSGDVETNNCHSDFPEDYDTHIELSAKPGEPASKRVIVEVTPRMRRLVAAQGANWSTDALVTSLTHKWIRVKGWMFFDYHHKGNAKNTKPNGTHLWRATGWELHPVTAIEVCSGGKATC
jgi:hypothetical protein